MVCCEVNPMYTDGTDVFCDYCAAEVCIDYVEENYSLIELANMLGLTLNKSGENYFWGRESSNLLDSDEVKEDLEIVLESLRTDELISLCPEGFLRKVEK